MNEAPKKGIIRTDDVFLTLGERRMFQRARESGTVSFFHIAMCKGCATVEIPKHDVKLYCSEECYKKAMGIDDASQEDQD